MGSLALHTMPCGLLESPSASPMPSTRPPPAHRPDPGPLLACPSRGSRVRVARSRASAWREDCVGTGPLAPGPARTPFPAGALGAQGAPISWAAPGGRLPTWPALTGFHC